MGVKNGRIREDELASMCGIGVKDLSKLAALLVAHRLIKRFVSLCSLWVLSLADPR